MSRARDYAASRIRSERPCLRPTHLIDDRPVEMGDVWVLDNRAGHFSLRERLDRDRIIPREDAGFPCEIRPQEPHLHGIFRRITGDALAECRVREDQPRRDTLLRPPYIVI